ncbi:zinc-binding dehydrogenase [Spongiactinospora gelatinilytica]|uniref:zinc-binding dehydrogenase n=1 Tax=Spongiactinospora gelatinilytica TaxID=2666298 RepID=UPI0018F76B34|nr:zinc-binding dehydrogenase [Spongiactinospora gelatinilytica]
MTPPGTIPATTRAAVLRAHGEPLVIEELPLPGECAPGAAVVEVTCATLCATDVHLWSGAMSFPGMLPLVLGHEMVGRVVAHGEDTRDALGRPIKVGDRIGWSESTCGHCHGCTVLREPVACANRGYGFMQRADAWPYATGGLAEHAYVAATSQKLLLPDDVADTWAAASGCAVKTVVHAFERAGGLRPGANVVIQGAGGLGLVATALATAAGAGVVITVGAPAARLDLATRFGADVTIGLSGEPADRVAEVMAATDGRGADLVLDMAGAPGVAAEAVDMAAWGGKYVVVGTTGPRPDPVPLGTVMGKQLAVLGSLNGDISDYHRAIEFLREFRSFFAWDELFSEPVGLAGASDALAAMSRLEQVKAVVQPGLS